MATKTAKPLTFSWPCRANKDQLLGLQDLLSGSHGAVYASLVTDHGPYRDDRIPFDELLSRSISSRWKELTLDCEDPGMRIHLRDAPYAEVAIYEQEPDARASADQVLALVRTWRALAQLPSHLFALVSAAALFAVLALGMQRVAEYALAPEPPLAQGEAEESEATQPSQTLDEWKAVAIAELGEEEANRLLEEAIERRRAQRERSEARDNSREWRDIGSLVVALAIGLAIFRLLLHPLEQLFRSLDRTWRAMFPAFLFDLPASKHHYKNKAVGWLFLILAEAYVVRLLGW